MLNIINYSAEQLTFIKQKISDEGFNADSWSNEDLTELKSAIRTHYLTEQKHTCPYCKQEIRSRNSRHWDIEHIIPRSHNPNFMFEPHNLCMSCVDCNIAKSNKKITNSKAIKKYPNKNSQFFIVHPHFDNYDECIIVIKAGFYYVAKNNKGEKTIEFCRLNRFYEFSEFGTEVQNDDRIFLLSEQLKKANNEETKKNIRREIAALAIINA